MNYKQFLEQLNIILDYNYFLDNEKSFQLENDEETFLNNLLLAPRVSLKSRNNILGKFLDKKLDKIEMSRLSEKLEDIFIHFNNETTNKKLKIREYAKYIIEFIKLENLKILLENNENNLDFIFYVIYANYNISKYRDVIELINHINKLNLIKKDNPIYNDILLYKLVSLKNIDKSYLKNNETMKEICKIAQNLFGFEFIRLSTLLECSLVSNDLNKTKDVFNSNFDILKKWDVHQLVNIFELIVYSKDEELYAITKRLLESKDILLLKSKELDIFRFLVAIKEENNLDLEFYKNKIKDDFDFLHYEYYQMFLK